MIRNTPRWWLGRVGKERGEPRAAMARTSFISMENFVQYVQPWLPDFVVRWIVWLYLAYFVKRIRRLDHPFKELRTVKRIMSDSKDKFERVADKTEAANEQHYEVWWQKSSFLPLAVIYAE